LPALMFLIIAATIMVRLDWRLAVLVIAFAPALIATRAAPEQTTRERTLFDRWAAIYSRFNEVLSGILIVRSFAMEDAEKARFLRDVGEANKVVVSGVATDAGYGSASNLVIALARIPGVGLGGFIQGEVTIGMVVAFLGYIGGLFGPVQGLPSGSGKTTMMALLMRFSDPIEGHILLDVQDLRTLKQSAIRRNIGVVLQDPLLFNDTICANIANWAAPGEHGEN
jgi:ABC-type multidrug transport system fused ATPase/permease subunit